MLHIKLHFERRDKLDVLISEPLSSHKPKSHYGYLQMYYSQLRYLYQSRDTQFETQVGLLLAYSERVWLISRAVELQGVPLATFFFFLFTLGYACSSRD